MKGSVSARNRYRRDRRQGRALYPGRQPVGAGYGEYQMTCTVPGQAEHDAETWWTESVKAIRTAIAGCLPTRCHRDQLYQRHDPGGRPGPAAHGGHHALGPALPARGGADQPGPGCGGGLPSPATPWLRAPTRCPPSSGSNITGPSSSSGPLPDGPRRLPGGPPHRRVHHRPHPGLHHPPVRYREEAWHRPFLETLDIPMEKLPRPGLRSRGRKSPRRRPPHRFAGDSGHRRLHGLHRRLHRLGRHQAGGLLRDHGHGGPGVRAPHDSPLRRPLHELHPRHPDPLALHRCDERRGLHVCAGCATPSARWSARWPR